MHNDRTFNHDAGSQSLAESLWVLPCHSMAGADWNRAFLSVRDDGFDPDCFSSSTRLSPSQRAIIGWEQGADRRFLICTRLDCTPFKDSFYRVRLACGRSDPARAGNVETMHRVLEERSVEPTWIGRP